MRGAGAFARRARAGLRGCGLAATLLAPAAPALAQEHPSAEAISQSNNPLSNLTGFNINEYYTSSLYDSDQVGSLLNMQAVLIPARRHLDIYHLVRATLPLETVPDSRSSYSSGLGDFTVQDAFKFSKPGARLEWGVGPLLVVPTATSQALGSGKWQAGAALVMIRLLPGGSIAGGVATWQTDFAGAGDRPGTNLASVQPNVALVVGATGYYISSSPIWTFDFENDRYLIPFSLGVGRVFLVGGTIVNVAVEPQVTVYHKGEQQPSMQLFFGLTLQWKGKDDRKAHSALANLPHHGSSSMVGPPTGSWTPSP
jgi:hypothetical protein